MTRALDKRSDEAPVLAADDKVAFPVADDRASGNLGGPLGDVHHVADPLRTHEHSPVGTPPHPARAQMPVRRPR